MARDFSARTDIDTSNLTDFPDGRLQDSNPASANNGTAVNEAVYGDIVQFFLKLLRDASITPNGNADTESNNQLIDAMRQLFVTAASTSLGLAIKVLEIGTWNMNTTADFQVPHGIANGKANIRFVFVAITQDSPGTFSLPIDQSAIIDGTVRARYAWDDTNVNLERDAESNFTTSNLYDGTGNRGWIVVLYEI